VTDDNIVWGNGDNIVWGQRRHSRPGATSPTTTVVWGNDESDNIVFGIDDSIVWARATTSPGATPPGTTLSGGNDHLRDVWASTWVSGFWDDNIAWGSITRDGMDNHRVGQWRDNIVWGNCSEPNNIVWGERRATSSGVTRSVLSGECGVVSEYTH
jgi:hypothetical protein